MLSDLYVVFINHFLRLTHRSRYRSQHIDEQLTASDVIPDDSFKAVHYPSIFIIVRTEERHEGIH